MTPNCTDTEHHYTCPECGNPAIERVMLPCSSCLEANPRPRRALPISMTCSGCKHWQQDAIAPDFGTGLEGDEFMEAPHRRCALVLHLPIGGRMPADKPYVVDGDQRGASLFTPPSFSCSLWAPKEPP